MWTIGLEDFQGNVDWSNVTEISIRTRAEKTSHGTLYIDGFYFSSTPETASGPNPPDGTEDVALKPTLSWIPGKNAIEHDVYIGTDKDAVNNATADPSVKTDIYKSRFPEPSFGFSSELEPKTTYYWRIDEVDADGKIIKGDIWSFTTGFNTVFDNFEYYNGENPL